MCVLHPCFIDTKVMRLTAVHGALVLFPKDSKGIRGSQCWVICVSQSDPDVTVTLSPVVYLHPESWQCSLVTGTFIKWLTFALIYFGGKQCKRQLVFQEKKPFSISQTWETRSSLNICTLFHVVFSWATAKGLYLQSCTRMEKSLGQTSRSNRQL